MIGGRCRAGSPRKYIITQRRHNWKVLFSSDEGTALQTVRGDRAVKYTNAPLLTLGALAANENRCHVLADDR